MLKNSRISLKNTYEITSISIDEFLQRIASQPNGNIWSVLVVPKLDSEFIYELGESLELFAECDIKMISGIVSSYTSARILI